MSSLPSAPAVPPLQSPDDAEERRKQEEVEFHDQRERDRLAMPYEEFIAKYPNKRFYGITRKSHDDLRRWMEEKCPGRVALDYCCGLGGMSVELAKHGAFVHGIDISPQEIATARRSAEAAGVAGRTKFEVMDAERTTFPDASFDLIICSGVLHHLDLNRAYPELARVLKPGGEIICIEALAHNPLINRYRRRTPHLRTAWEVDHILRVQDIERARRFFGTVDVRFYYLAAIAAIPFQGSAVFRPLLGALEALDAVLLRVPGLRRMAWQAIFTLRDPKRM